MTKKHFQALAAALRACKPTDPNFPGQLRQWAEAVRSVAIVCAQTNPRFDRARFLAACGMED